MTKYSLELKVKAVFDYLEGKDSFNTVANRYNVSLTPLKNWVAHYIEHGIEGLTHTYTNYNRRFKMDVLTYMTDFGVSITQAAAVYYRGIFREID
ncbi:transposase [Peribacillus asahii]|uniref:transposase n=1 Tax=Peribacillus asahii TaxID=228899 RepID=UPI00207963CE|nr:transposase [Peribacillus asahii]USK87550.1 transposase [Peribacillus asahii]